jgi:benzoate-CoA ligase
VSGKRERVQKTVNVTEALLEPVLARGQGTDPAIICGDDVVTYEMLAERVNRAGNVFKGFGVELGERVLMIVRDTPAFFYAYLGLIKIGAVPVALNLRLTETDLAYVLGDSAARVLVMDREFHANFPGVQGLSDPAPRVILGDEPLGDLPVLGDLMEDASPELEPARLPPDSPCYWVYSSGTTGKPKGVVHHHRMIYSAAYFLGDVIGVKRGDRVFCTSKLFFAYTLGHSLFSTLRLGATAVLYPDWPDTEAIADVVERQRPTVLLSVPTFYRNLLRGGIAERDAFKNVQRYISAGERLSEQLFEEWRAVTGKPIIEGIGASETIFLFLANSPNNCRAGFTGQPTPNTQVRLVNLEGRPVRKPGDAGVMWVKMGCLADGYWDLPERTEATFQDGWYCTNDMFIGAEDDWYAYQGRGDDMLKISGQWVAPAEIEEVVLKHPGVIETAVVGVTDRDGLVRLALFMVAPDAKGNTDALETEIRDSLTATLAVYKCPRRMYVIDEMPLTATGKLQRFQLRQMAAEHERTRAA